MHFPEFKLVDRIKTRTFWAGIKYFGSITFRIIIMRVFGSKNSIYLDAHNDKKSIIDNFHILYEEKHKQTYDNTFWMGINSMKCPLDLWIYQELIFKTKPDIIIETGTNKGGSALFLANVCDLLNNGQIITVDFAFMENRPQHKRIHYLQGDSVGDKTILEIKKLIEKIDDKSERKVMVILDDDHSEKHVFNEMEIYGKLVTKGNYLIVEDTSMGGHPVWPELKRGPMEAVQKYMQIHDNFEIDKNCEKFLLTFNPNGYLKKITP